MNEKYFVSSFINGLNDDLRSMVKMIRPRSVHEATKDVLLQELMVEALMKKQRGQMRGVNPGMAPLGGTIQNKENFKGGTRVRYMANSVPNPSLPQRNKLIEQRRAVGLCFKCGDKYTIGH